MTMSEKQNKKDSKKMSKKKKALEKQKEEYVPGSVSSFLGSGNQAKLGGDGSLSSFFKPSVVKQTTITATKRVKAVTSKVAPETGTERNSGSEANPAKKNSSNNQTVSGKAPSLVKRNREEADEEEFAPQQKKKKHHKAQSEDAHDPLVLARTVFVGNLPINITKQELKGLFKTYGTIESIRFRSMGVADLSVSKKVAAIKQEINPKKQSFNAYIAFKEEQAAQAALKSNGKLVNKHHLRVDIAGNDKKHDMKRSVFVGNLPFDLPDEDLRNHFEEFGTVEGIRIIRDKATGVGKGFGYVLFEDSTSVQYAVKTDGSKLKGRKLRIKRAVKKEKHREQRDHPGGKRSFGPPRRRNSGPGGRGGSAPRKSRSKSSGKAAGGFKGRKGAGRPPFKGQKGSGKPPFKGKKRPAKGAKR